MLNANVHPLPTDSVPKTSTPSTDGVQGASSRFVTIKELSRLYGLKMGSIYAFIKTEPNFPYVNVGIKKRFLIDVIEFESWLMERTKKQKREHFAIPSAVDLIKVFKTGVGK
jgi:predicted DNA-binding transcriptional regulator AlpA